MMEEGRFIVWRDRNEMQLIREIAHDLYFHRHKYHAEDLAVVWSMLDVIWAEPLFDTFEFIIRTTLCFFGYSLEFFVTPVLVIPEATIPDRHRSLFSYQIPHDWRDAVDERHGFWSAQYTVESMTHTLTLTFDHSFVPPYLDDGVKIYFWARGAPDGCGKSAIILPRLVEKYNQTDRQPESVFYIQDKLFSTFTQKLKSMSVTNPFCLPMKSCVGSPAQYAEFNPEAVQILAAYNGVIP